MKKIVYVLLVIVALCGVAVAKFDPYPGYYEKRSEGRAQRYFSKYNVTDDDKMTLEQFKSRPTTVSDRQQMKRDQEDGTYISDEEKFKAMDMDQDGYVSKDEMAKYIYDLSNQNKTFY